MSFECAGDGYAEQVGEWIANPHAYFKSFGPEARTFQKKHPSERLRTMTLVAPAAELAVLRPVRLSLDGREVVAKSGVIFFGLEKVGAAYQPELFPSPQSPNPDI